MPSSKELTIQSENWPGTLAKCCKSLADHNVNILAFQAVPTEGNSVVHLVVDNPSNAKRALDGEHLSYTETEVAQAKMPNRPGELGRVASQLGEANINIEHAYSGLDASNSPVLFFGVQDVNKAWLYWIKSRRRHRAASPHAFCLSRCRRKRPDGTGVPRCPHLVSRFN